MGIQAMALLLLSLAIPNLVNCNTEGDILHAQKVAWVDPHQVLQSWDSTLVNPCTWYHVTCNNNNSVIRVDLGNAGLSGPLVPQLGGLKNLQYLELFRNNITGAIPSTFGDLTNLVSLDLYSNVISGVIPPALGNLRSLKYLRLNGNNLTGALPLEVLNLATVGSLEILNVSDNSLAGTVISSHHRVTSFIQDESSRTPPSEET